MRTEALLVLTALLGCVAPSYAQIARCTWSRCPDVGMCHVYRDGAGGYKSECWGCETGADKVYVEGSVCESSTDAGSEDQEDCTTREAWSDAKRRWCCVEKNLGCPDCPASSPVRCPADSRMAGTCAASDADCSSDGAEGTVVKRCRWSQCAGGVCYVYEGADGAYSMCGGCGEPEKEKVLEDKCPQRQREVSVCYNPGCPAASKCRVTIDANGALSSTCSPACDASVDADEVKQSGNVCEANVADGGKTSGEAASATAGSEGQTSSLDVSVHQNVQYCVWHKTCQTGTGRCGVMDLGPDAGGIVTGKNM